MSIDDKIIDREEDFCAVDGDVIFDSLCTWYKTMRENINGKGTTFYADTTKYSSQQKKCYACDGLASECPLYVCDEK